MAKEKKASKAAAVAPKAAASKKIETVKAGRVTKTNDKPKELAKKTAEKTAKAVSKKSKKAKEPTPEPSSSESESEDESVAATSEASSDDEDAAATSDSSSDESDEVEVKPKTKGAAKVNGKVNGKTNGKAKDDSSDSDSDASSDDETPVTSTVAAPKSNGQSNGAATSDSSESESEDGSDAGSDEEVDTKPGAKAVQDDSDDSAESASDADSDSDSGSASEEEDEEEKPQVSQSKKRKADTAIEQTPKKTKTEGDANAKTNLFVGGLSWNVDEAWLTSEFEEFGELAGVRIITHADTGRSKGFGYVEFVSGDAASKAFEAKNGAEIDGRAIRLDFSEPRNKDNQTPKERSFDRAKQYGDQTNPPAATLFVGNLKFDVTEEMVQAKFSDFGAVKSIRLPTDRETGQPKGFGYVEMYSVEEATGAFEALQGADISGRSIRLDYATVRPQNDSPGGRGGFGGRGGRGGRGGQRGGRGGFGDRGGRGGSRGGRGGTTNRGGFGDFSGKKTTF